MADAEIIAKLLNLGIEVKHSPRQQKVKCPSCNSQRQDKRDKSLSVNIELGVYRCHYCGMSGCVVDNSATSEFYKPIEPSKNDKLSDVLINFLDSRGISRDTAREAKISEEDKWIAKADKKTGCIVFNYYEKGRLVNKKYRSISDKGFALEPEAKLVFYNIDSIIAEKEVIITEGEIDCLTFIECGIKNVISVPNGANRNQNNLKYLDNCVDYFNDIEKIYLAVDNDDAGLSLRDELIRRFGKDKCLIVKYPEGCKDANEVLLQYGASHVVRLVDESEEIPLEGIVYADSETENIMALYRSGIERGIELKELGDEFCKLCTFQRSRLYTVTGIPSHGKSGFTEDIEVILAAKEGWKFGIFSPEHYPLSYMVYKYAELIVGKPFFAGSATRMSVAELNNAIEFIKDHFFFIRPKDEMFTLDAILDIAKSLVKRYGIHGVVIDPWNTVNHEFEGESETKYIEKALNKITLFKQEHNVLFIIVAHPKKMMKESGGERGGQYEVPNLYEINGSSNFFNKTDVGFTVYRDYKEDCTYIYMQKVKYRNLGEVGQCKFKFNRLNNRYTPIDTFGQYKFDEKSYISEGEQIEMPISSAAIKSNKSFENNEDWEDLPF